MHAAAYPLVVLAPVLGLGVYCVAHVILSRLRVGRPPYAPLVLGFFPGGIVTIVIALLGLHELAPPTVDRVALVLLDGMTYGSLGWCYFHFVNLGIASLRIRVLQEMAEAGGTLRAEALRARYHDGLLAETRIRRLVSGGHVVVRDGRCHRGSPAFLWTARGFELLRRLILGDRTS